MADSIKQDGIQNGHQKLGTLPIITNCSLLSRKVESKLDSVFVYTKLCKMHLTAMNLKKSS